MLKEISVVELCAKNALADCGWGSAGAQIVTERGTYRCRVSARWLWYPGDGVRWAESGTMVRCTHDDRCQVDAERPYRRRVLLGDFFEVLGKV